MHPQNPSIQARLAVLLSDDDPGNSERLLHVARVVARGRDVGVSVALASVRLNQGKILEPFFGEDWSRRMSVNVLVNSRA